MSNLNNNHFNNTEKSYRVVRYYPDFGLGVVADIIGDHLTIEEAKKMAKDNPPLASDEKVFIEEEDEEKAGSR